jgi:hypothetical protein
VCVYLDPIISQWFQTMTFISIATLNPHKVVSSSWPVVPNDDIEL